MTSVICKLLDNNIREEAMSHLSGHHLLLDSQFGFRKNRSTILHQLTAMEEWTEAIDKITYKVTLLI